ncbi:MAG: 2-amino-4-hydroxy-6-hydroxymethyldihydropteridine diphosphokinase [Pirellulaceae bacterium]|nr:2-amino-4-hydroxy-6-hydroxymethyldihydropteridine diphosphokinase [Pirellulaceae bacterium]MDP7303827.1 2-amino-4-hydroxy-6-hydroxymethyldihydropteridine diphosphokinase [Pirellulaceae bacterium]HJN11020.1 2-amino-4-hydroxy-6-hydroxymethyldihydropteridine diphosphokinase [Pirellulaceae bacterium]
MATCLIGLGANQGDRAANLAAAVELLSKSPEISVIRQSNVYSTKAAVGGTSQNGFLNSVLTLQTALAPTQLLSALQQIEVQLGRHRQDRWAAREIDLDLLLYDDLVLSDSDLVLPHPRMAFRRFVLEPAAEIAPDFVHPATKFTVMQLLSLLHKLPRRITITGASSQQNKSLARQVAEKSNARLVEEPRIAELPIRLAELLASPSCRTAIELVGRQRHLRHVRTDPSNADAASVTEISSSWVGDSYALAKLLLPSVELKEFERSWKNVQNAEELDRTTLIVVLLAPGDGEWAAPLQAEIRRLATVPRRSPWILLDAQDPDWALTEVVAAIEAMQ